MNRRSKAVLALLAVALLAGLAFWLRPGPPLPAGLEGALVFVSNRDGIEALYWRRLPKDRERRLTYASEPVREPRISPDGSMVAFAMGGRIGTVAVASGEVRMLTLGIDWKDAMPAWRPDGKALVVCARRSAGDTLGLHLLDLETDGTVGRHPLTETRGLDDTSPVVSPDGTFVVFVREDHLWRVSLKDGRASRLTQGFRKSRAPRFLSSGRLVCLWNEGKQHGLDRLDADGKNRETLWQGAIYYRTIAPSPDGRFFAATFTYDLDFHPAEALKLRQTEEVRLLDERGSSLAVLERSARHQNHSPDWGP
jgi:Tol biopolymer transport system component